MVRSLGSLVALALLVGCGSEQGTGDDAGSSDATALDASDGALDDGPSSDAADAPATFDASCMHGGGSCDAPADCCSGVCTAGKCACTSDGQACSTWSECCSGTCASNGTCSALQPFCKTLGNACKQSGDCCSQLCSQGTCSSPSYCGQNGEICASASECCGGLCDPVSNFNYGTCSVPFIEFPCRIDGTICDGSDAGCGAGCCSRACALFAPTGISICQHSSGCRSPGEYCADDNDCCGARCNRFQQSDPVGRCGNPAGCNANGSICQKALVCVATQNCCSGSTLTNDTCNADNEGVLRCNALQCVGPGQACGSSADCCNGWPCVRNPAAADAGADAGLPTFVCYSSSCVPSCGPCTDDADCCGGGMCKLSPGSTQGVCQPCNHT